MNDYKQLRAKAIEYEAANLLEKGEIAVQALYHVETLKVLGQVASLSPAERSVERARAEPSKDDAEGKHDYKRKSASDLMVLVNKKDGILRGKLKGQEKKLVPELREIFVELETRLVEDAEKEEGVRAVEGQAFLQAVGVEAWACCGAMHCESFAPTAPKQQQLSLYVTGAYKPEPDTSFGSSSSTAREACSAPAAHAAYAQHGHWDPKQAVGPGTAGCLWR